MRPCHDLHPNPSETAASCRLCYLYLHDASYRALWDSEQPITTAQRVTSCRHLGEPLLGIERDRLGLDHARDWKHCLHPTQPLGPVVCACAGCGSNCSGFSVDASLFSGPELLPGLSDPLEAPTDANGYLHALKQLAFADMPIPDTTAGEGIITVGGGIYWPMIVVSVRMLRESGCTLPVEVWHRSSENVRPEDVAGLGVTLINADEVGKVPPKGGWECKLHALTHTRFRRVLFLDADAYCVADPTEIIQQGGFTFWQDLPYTWTAVNWEKVGFDGQHIPPVQGGQIVMDRADPRVWKLIVLAHWMCRHSEWYFQCGYGDQDTWRIALALTKFPFSNLGEASWDRKAFICQHRGSPLIVHRCQGKLGSVSQIPHGQTSWNSPQPGLPKEDRVFHHLAQVLARENDPKSVFGAIYDKGLWGDRSGPGSSHEEARPFVEILQGLITVGGWRTIVDAGCGDGRVAAMIQSDLHRYTGVDIVESVIQKNQIEQPTKGWLVGDITKPENLPPADVLICRDVLHHWPTELIREWLTEVMRLAQKEKKWLWLVLCQDREQHTSDCHLGGYRGLDPLQSPLKEFGPFSRIDYLHKSILVRRL
jgi:hypothetical protein